MIALRKDVKVGFMIGGVVLGVFGVYLGLNAFAGGKPDTSMTGANLQVTPIDPKSPTPAVVDRGTASNRPIGSAAATNDAAARNNGPTLANPSQGLSVAEANGADIWGNAFETGKLQPVVTVTPDANRNVPGTLKPSEVISAITNPPADGDAKTKSQGNEAPSKPENGSGTATTADPSGSMADLTSSSLLQGTQNSSAAQTHTIEAGETFSSISATYYGDAKYFNLIVDANPQIDPNKLKPGVKIKVPALVKKEPRSDTTDVPAESRIDPNKQYLVKSGDSLNRIASALYGDSNMWQKIYDLNKSTIGDSPAKLKLGMVLNLPSPPTRK